MSDKAPVTREWTDVPGAQTLMRGIDVLMTIGTAASPRRFRDISEAVGLPNGTLHRLLAALQRRRLVRYDERTRTYHLGPGVLELARHSLDHSNIRAAKPELSRLARLLDRAVCLYVRDGDEVFVIDFEDPDASNTRVVRVWPRQSLAGSAAGQAMLAQLAPQQRSTLRGAEREPRDDTWIGLTQALGYRLTRSDTGKSSAVAASVRDVTGYPVAAICCQIDEDLDAERLHEIGRLIAEAAQRATGNMGMNLQAPDILPAPPDDVDSRVRPLQSGRDYMGESPVWCSEGADAGKLLWLDILAPALRSYAWDSQEAQRTQLPEIVGGVVPAKSGRLVLLGQSGMMSYDQATGRTSLMVSPEADRPDNRFNTAAVDAAGNIWAGTMAIDHRPSRGALYRITPELQVRRYLDGISLPKNPAWSSDNRRMYLGDGATGVVQVFDFDLETGTLGEGRVFAAGGSDRGTPNGIAIDAEDHLWVAMLGGWAIHRYSPDGRLVERISLPLPMPTNICFGGPDLRTLFVTSTYLRLPPGYSTIAPLSGRLMALDVNVAGQPPRRFGEAAR
jgi:sugar lactone lactonase YvrE/DNA-binding IclR family transcriptional regulator